jgi:hypothetical protein
VRSTPDRAAEVAPTTDAHAQVVGDYFRCADILAPFVVDGEQSDEEGYFRFGGAICYGRRSGGAPAAYADCELTDVSAHASQTDRCVHLPFSLADVVGNLRHERYRPGPHGVFHRVTASRAIRNVYYSLRPLLPVGVRRHLQRLRLSGWDRIVFPRWPIDTSVEMLMQRALALQMKALGIDRLPFVWFWPDGARSCAMMTHDVEGPSGRGFCEQLMDLDDRFAVKSAFQLVPDAQGEAVHALAERLRRRGFEVNLHDLTHDGYLFHDRQEFARRAEQINRYARQLHCNGFRSGSMYREQQWYNAFEFSYDMSVPNAAHLEPQRGGCCTVLPYFVGDILELPLTTTQDYSLFHILGQYTTDVWEQQVQLLLASNGLISFITHPDYLRESRALSVYTNLLSRLRQLQADEGVWIALPGEIDRWWRNRNQMTVVQRDGAWRIEGPDSRRARLSYATLTDDGSVVYAFE